MATYVQFDVAGQGYALPVQTIVEVLHLVEITPIPDQAEDHIGVMTLRGRVIPVIDLGQRYHGEPTPLRINTPMMVLKHTANLLGMVVGQVHDVINLDDVPEPSPEPVIQGILYHKGETILVPSLDMLFADAVQRN